MVKSVNEIRGHAQVHYAAGRSAVALAAMAPLLIAC